MQHIWNIVFYQPLENVLAFLVGVTPFGDLGIAVITLTVLVKVALSPLSGKSIKSQLALKALEPELQKIREQEPDKALQAQKIFALYKEKKVNPFSGCLLVLLQFPVIIALYFVFLRGVTFTDTTLYSFITLPEVYRVELFGLISMTEKSLLLALLAGITQYIQILLIQPKQTATPTSTQEIFAQNLQKQMKYVLPVLITIFAFQAKAAVALYWTTSNLFTIAQEWYVRKRYNS